MKVLISIPAYNEERTLRQLIKDIRSVMKQTKHSFDIQVIDDGSKDATAKVAKSAGAKVYSHPYNLGLAETFKTELNKFKKSKAEVLLHTDADGQYPCRYIPQLLEKIEQGNDLVLGSRFDKGNYQGSLFKKMGNLAFAHAFSSLLRTKITDTTTGFRAFNRKVAELPLINDFTYTQEQLIRTSKARLKIAEIPIKTFKTRKSKLFRNVFDYAIKAWINIFRIYRDYEPLKFFGVFGAVFIGIGLLIDIWLLSLFFMTGKVGHTPSLILSMLLIIVGVQIILFGFVADMIKSRL